jgi:excisionase family DNA binding protein
MEDEILTIKEFAALVKMHYNTIFRAIKKGRINAFRISSGKKAAYRIPKSEINRIGILDLEIYINAIVEKRLKNEKKC